MLDKIYLKIKLKKQLYQTEIGKKAQPYIDGYDFSSESQNAYEKCLDCEKEIDEFIGEYTFYDNDIVWLIEYNEQVHICLKQNGITFRRKVPVWINYDKI